MVERQPRARLLDHAQTVSASTVVAATGYSAHVLPTLIFDQVKCELFLRILGPDILLDVVPDQQGGLKPKPVSSDRAVQSVVRLEPKRIVWHAVAAFTGRGARSECVVSFCKLRANTVQ